MSRAVHPEGRKCIRGENLPRLRVGLVPDVHIELLKLIGGAEKFTFRVASGLISPRLIN